MKKIFLISLFSFISLTAANGDQELAILKQTDTQATTSKTRTLKTSKPWEDICEQSKNAVVQIFTIAKTSNILVPFNSPSRQAWLGSGFFIKPDGYNEGYILSNFHVVEEKELCFMQMPALSDERFPLDVVGCCPDKDIALLKLNEKDCAKVNQILKVTSLPYLKLGDSDAIYEGEEIMALGFPRGMKNFKGSKGICSGRESCHIGECIQTTAPINQGNSGGPAVDATGKVIGISFLKPVGDGIEGIAFLIPINDVLRILPQLNKEAILRLPFWDFEYNPTTPFELNRWQVPTNNGIYIKKVYTASLFEEAGLRQGDIIYQVNGNFVDRFGYLDTTGRAGKINIQDYLNYLAIDSTATIVAYRNGTAQEFSIPIKARNPFKIDKIYPPYEKFPPYEVIGGLIVSEISLNHIEEIIKRSGGMGLSSDEMINFFSYTSPNKRHENRVIIGAVLPDSQGEKTGCIGGCFDRIISKVNDISVKTIDDFRNAVRKSIGHESLVISTEGGTVVELSVADIVADEEILRARNEFYPRSPLIDELASGLK